MPLTTYHAALLHAKAYRILRTDVARMLKPFNISLPEWTLLGILDKDPKTRSTSIAQELGVEIPMVTNLLNALESKEMIKREQSLEDKRERTLTLTTLGKETILCSERQLHDELTHYFKGVSTDDMYGYLRVLEAIVKKSA